MWLSDATLMEQLLTGLPALVMRAALHRIVRYGPLVFRPPLRGHPRKGAHRPASTS
jgi:hypothetical protein